MKYGEIACALNHIACWQHALELKSAYVAVFEDDATFCRDVFTRIPEFIRCLDDLDPGWGLLYLGRERIGIDLGQNGLFVRPGFSYCTYAYVLSKKGLNVLVNYNLRGSLIPLDEFFAATYCEHPREDVRRIFQPAIRAYALRTDCVFEGDDRILGSDTEASDECGALHLQIREGSSEMPTR